MENSELKDFLEAMHDRYNRREFIESDPVSIPHLFTKKEDIEIAAFFAATIAWGNRKMIIQNANRLMELMDMAPHNFIVQHQNKDLNRFGNFTHRTFNGDDCIFFIKSLKRIYKSYSSLEDVFSIGYANDQTVKTAISNFRKEFFKTIHETRAEKHISNPDKNSACKRLNLFLRWMVRKDNRGVDFGLWKSISPSALFCPLDVHAARVATKLSLLKREQKDWKATEELTINLRKFDPDDPVKYDFALFGLGVFEKF